MFFCDDVDSGGDDIGGFFEQKLGFFVNFMIFG